MELKANQFKEAASVALHDQALRAAVHRAADNVARGRAGVLGELEDVAALRQQARAARLRALDSLPELLEQLETNVIANGGQVLWAVDGAEANQHVLDICRRHDLKRGVKSKSMVTEETGLIPILEANGIEMVETDLGEFIVQISHDRPSHLVMPVMHRSKEEIGDILVEKLGMPPTESAEEMTAFARQVLRDRYLEADFGMSGGNFLIAETGTIVVVTNEGNGRLSTGLPPVYIAMVGIEKVIPTWEDFAALLPMLTRISTGQRLSVYTNMVNGPATEKDPDGPEHCYLILVDNGRSTVYTSEYAEALACVRCGACLGVCPVFQNIGGHAYGSVYSGPIGSVITPVMRGKENAIPLPFASSLCGACKEVCPVDINIPDMLLRLRRDLEPLQDPLWKAGMKGWQFSFQHPLLYQMGGKMAGLASQALAEEGRDAIDDSLPIPGLDAWTNARDMPLPSAETFHEWWRKNRT